MAPPHLRAGSGVARRRPSGVLARLLRSPVTLYEHNLGWLLGHRFAEITHPGRKSGRVFRSVVEVARFDPRTREVVVVSAWRGQTDWYRNIQMEPALLIRTGRLRFVPVQRSLPADETIQEMESYVHRNRLAARLMPWLFGIDLRRSTPDTYAATADFFKGVSFRPRQ